MHRLFLVLLLVGGRALVTEAAPHTAVRLVLDSATARPGSTILAGVELKMDPNWHTYWRNAGESGLGTQIEWTLPPGWTAGPIQWPVPEKYDFSGLTTYVYHDEVVLLAPIQIAPQAPPGKAELSAQVAWLECEEQCLPGKGAVRAELIIGDAATPSPEAALLQRWQQRLPRKEAAARSAARWDGPASNEERPLVIEWKLASTNTADFYPYESSGYSLSGATDLLQNESGNKALRKKAAKTEGGWPGKIAGLLVETGPDHKPLQAFETELAVAEAGTSPGAGPAAAATTDTAGSRPQSLAKMLLLGFLGGLILNFMPCVLPVIALKILGFVNQTREEPRRMKQLGLVYAGGVIASFIALAALVIAVQKAGKLASWGMQFQNPQFLIAMTVLVTLVSLNLFGLFEVTLGGGAMDAAGRLASREGASGAFFNGVLATALATPCTAPFLGIALGFAFTQPPYITLIMFIVVGIGLAAPYVLLAWNPALLKFLPRPGAWMERFKIALGFPVLGTAVWLSSLAIGHFGVSGALWLGIFLVLLALAAWIWGEFVQRGSKLRPLAMACAAGVLAFSYFYILENQLRWRNPPRAAALATGSPAAKPDGIPWQKWSPEAVAKARAEGRPVLVDFTADWCLTCQANKKTSLEIPAVRERLARLNAVSLLGDYTREDPAIAAELRKYQRAGVPLVLVFPADPQAPPIVLPEVLTPGIVLNALEKAAGGASQTASLIRF